MSRARYRFEGFVLSPGRRQLLREGHEVPLIPRYFDLLVLLIERRHQAVARRELLDHVWDDVVVSDNALNQAVRVLRAALGDDSRSPTYIRTAARHGYQFVYPRVQELDDDGPLDPPASAASTALASDGMAARASALEALLDPAPAPDDAERGEAAERLHALGTEAGLRSIEGRPGTALARALLREARWAVPGAGEVPFLGRPDMWRSAWLLARLRLRALLEPARQRWLAGTGAAAVAGLVAGLAGGAVLRFGPGATATDAVLVALPVIGAAIATTGAAGVGLGITLAEVVFRKLRRAAVLVGGALGGGLAGAIAHALGASLLESLFGASFSPLAGGLEGLVIGGGAAAGYAAATVAREGGMAAPRGVERLRVVLATGLGCAAAAGYLGWRGSHLGAQSLDLVAGAFPHSQVALDPLARLLGETAPGITTRVAVSVWEGLLFGLGLSAGLTRRPRPGGGGEAGGTS